MIISPKRPRSLGCRPAWAAGEPGTTSTTSAPTSGRRSIRAYLRAGMATGAAEGKVASRYCRQAEDSGMVSGQQRRERTAAVSHRRAR